MPTNARPRASSKLPPLTALTMRGFKAVKDSGPVPLRPFNVIIGRNGSGKSSLIEALQWIDTALRSTVPTASDRFRGLTHLLHVGAEGRVKGMEIEMRWGEATAATTYRVEVRQQGKWEFPLQETLSVRAATRTVTVIKDPEAQDLLSLTRDRRPKTAAARDFWSNVVFLRLTPTLLGGGAAPFRGSLEPILDEEGRQLARLLKSLSTSQRGRLLERLSELVPGMSGMALSKPSEGQELEYALVEELPEKTGKAARKNVVPAWMLSEGTRRIVAILALLECSPAPSLLCIEEIENGLDPWVVQRVVQHLRAASDQGVQVIVTTHSPWLLDDVPLDDILLVERTGGETVYRRFADLDAVKAFSPYVPPGTRYVQGLS
jgi:predicted ATPase